MKLVEFSEQFDKQIMDCYTKLSGIPDYGQSLQQCYKYKERINEMLKIIQQIEAKLPLRQKSVYCSGKITLPFNSLLLIAQSKLKMLDDCQYDFEVQF